MKRVLFLGRSTKHFPYVASILEELAADPEVDLMLAFSRKWSKSQFDSALISFCHSFPDVSLSWIPYIKSNALLNIIYVLRELETYLSYHNRTQQSQFYRLRWRSYLPHWLAFLADFYFFRCIIILFLKIGFLRALEAFNSRSTPLVDYIYDVRPTCVFASPANMRFCDLVDILIVCRQLSIPLIYLTLSWDNLTTKGLYHVRPDRLLVWNKTQFNEAVHIHKLAPHSISIIGSPFFDKWFSTVDRPIVNDSLNLDKYILYLGSSKNIAKDESYLVEELSVALSSSVHSSTRSIKIYVRPHPANKLPFARLKNNPMIHVLNNTNLPSLDDDKNYFYSLVRGSTMAIAINTSAIIDVTILGGYCGVMLLKEYAPTQAEALHFRYIADSKSVALFTSVYDVADFLDNNPSRLNTLVCNYRSKFIRDFIRPFGIEISAGQLGYYNIKNLLDTMKIDYD